MKASASRPKRSRKYRKHGFQALKTALSKAGIGALDGRSAQARAIKAWQADIEADLGDLSTAQRSLLGMAAVDAALLAHADASLRELDAKVITGRGKARGFIALVKDRQAVAAALQDRLKLLGLRRTPKTVNLSARLASMASTGLAARGEGKAKPRRPQERTESPDAPKVAEAQRAAHGQGERVPDGTGSLLAEVVEGRVLGPAPEADGEA